MKSSTFQLVIIIVFSLFVALGMIVLYWTNKGGSGQKTAEIHLWGSVPSGQMKAFLSGLKLDKQNLNVIYQEVPADSFDEKLIEALASGIAPDAIVLNEDSIYRHIGKITPIPYQSFSERAFKDAYVTEAEVYLNKNGVIGVPFSIDPLIMYWNRDMFANKGLAKPPRYWDEFLTLSSKLTEKKGASGISKSAVALGEFSNINNAKEIISALSMQSGNYFTAIGEDGALVSRIDNEKLIDVLDFYSQFANPLKTVFSWSRSLPNSQSMFGRGDLAVYFGFFSEKNNIVSSNSNFDFDFGYFPQVRNSDINITYGNMLAVSVLKQARDSASAMKLAVILGSGDSVKAWSEMTGLPPVRRDLLVNKPTDAFGVVGYDSALISRAWLDPNGKKTKELFRDMVEAISSGWQTSSDALSSFSAKLSELLATQ
jgi:multiple sugar transport system substrate-binding protein